MSRGLFVPTALYGKDVLTDATAIYFEQLFIKGFVNEFKCRDTIYAWDLGNECNCAGVVNNSFEAASWTATISNAIRAADSTRPVISGMHGLTIDGNWTIDTQAQFTDMLTTHPYTVNMVERELGLIDNTNTPKPTLCEMKKFAEFLANNDIKLPAAQEQGVCLLTKGQDHWAIAYMTYILSRQCGLNFKFADAFSGKLPESNLYLMPSVNGIAVMHKETFDELKQRIFDGADLYMSLGSAHLEGFENLVGLKVIDSYICGQGNKAIIDDKEIPIYRSTVRKYEPTTAEVIANDKNGNPFITVNKYGKGRVFFVDSPIEACLVGNHNAVHENTEKIYQTIFKDHIDALPAKVADNDIAVTYHPEKDGGYIVAINHSAKEKALNISLCNNLKIEKVIYGDIEIIKPYDACILKIK